ncbi:hypothetical protein [Massilia sp. BHUDP2]|uniref:hypothetical protein n=1 Tax=Massilia sp. BHUDP2 TaxID=3034505 RepID=UPI003905DF75
MMESEARSLMRDYRFFFLAEAFRGLKTTDFVSRGTFSRAIARVFHVEQKTKKPGEPGFAVSRGTITNRS